MRILMTTGFLVSHTGSEEVIRDLSHALLRRRHSVTIYSPTILNLNMAGVWSAEISITDDIARVETPDVIHAQHAIAYLRAWQRFPTVPIVHFIHDVNHTADEPVRLPSIVKYVAVDECRARRALAAGIPRDRVAVVPNAVDLARFPQKPGHRWIRRVLAVSKYHNSFKRLVRQGLHGRGFVIDFVESGGFRADFGELLHEYDLLIGSGRCALEAAAVGLSVIVCDERGFAGPLTGASWAALRAGNFGKPTFTGPTDAAAISQALAELDPLEAAALVPIVRKAACLECQVDLIEDIYGQALKARPLQPEPEKVRDILVADILRMHKSGFDLLPEDIRFAQQAGEAADLSAALSELAEVRAELDDARAQLKAARQAA